MNYNLIYKNVENLDGNQIKVLDKSKTLESVFNLLKNAKGGNVNQAQLNGLIQDSEKKTAEVASLKTQITKLNNDNKKLSNNLVKLLKRVEKLEKDDATSASIPEF